MGLIIRVARTEEEIKQCLQVRNMVFVKELGFIDGEEKDSFDLLPTTTHFLALHNKKGVGTARLIGPNRRMAEKKKTMIFGLPIEDYFDLSEYKKKKITPYEISRSSVIKSERTSRVILDIWKISIMYGKQNSITTFCSCAGTETDSLQDAAIIYRLLRLKNYFHPSIRTRPLEVPVVNPVPRFQIYDKKIKEEVLEKMALKDFEEMEINLPPTLDYFTRIGAKFTGPPVFFSIFKMYTIPMILDINNTNEPFRTFFTRESPYIQLQQAKP